MEYLFNHSLVDDTNLQKTRELQYFGKLINNTDMHSGNLSLSIKGNKFQLLPAYDMCSMGFAPKSGEALPFEFTPVSASTLRRKFPYALISLKSGCQAPKKQCVIYAELY